MVNVMEEMQAFVEKVSSGEHESVKPGQTVRFTEACTVNDRIWQGDLALTVMAGVPKEGYKLSKNSRSSMSTQLVVGNTEGAKHCLPNTEGVDVYLPEVWNADSLDGPILVCHKEATVVHPVHGHVVIPAGFVINCTYQRELDKETAKEIRARD